eukprot:7484623-Pyramimonas_sp.AAC.1
MAVPSLATSAPRLFFEGVGLCPAVRAADGPAASWVKSGLAYAILVVRVHRELVVLEELVGVVSHHAVGFLHGCIAARPLPEAPLVAQ